MRRKAKDFDESSWKFIDEPVDSGASANTFGRVRTYIVDSVKPTEAIALGIVVGRREGRKLDFVPSEIGNCLSPYRPIITIQRVFIQRNSRVHAKSYIPNQQLITQQLKTWSTTEISLLEHSGDGVNYARKTGRQFKSDVPAIRRITDLSPYNPSIPNLSHSEDNTHNTETKSEH